jgi:hypothetical protein
VPGTNGGAEKPLKAGTVVMVTDTAGGRCMATGYGWTDLSDLEWVTEKTGAGVDAKFLRVCGRKKRALVLDQSGMPWVWSESLEGILKFSDYIADICVGFDGPAVWYAVLFPSSNVCTVDVLNRSLQLVCCNVLVGAGSKRTLHGCWH